MPDAPQHDWSINLGRARGLDVTLDPFRLLESRLLVCGSSGCGKSWLLRLIAEQAAPRIPTIILDPEGEYATLREAVDVVLVAADGDVRPTVTAAPTIARRLLELGTSAVVALDDLRAGEQQRFVASFLDGLMDAPRAAWRPLLVMLDEAHRFASQHDDSPSSGAVANLLSRGRKRGFGSILATQRLSKLHKNVAAECNNVLVGRTTLDIDVARARDVLGLRTKDEAQRMRALAPGHWFAIGPALSPTDVGELVAAKVKTTHPRPGLRHALRPPEPSAGLRKKLAELADLAEASKGQILTLEQACERIAELEASRGPSREALAEAAQGGRLQQRSASVAAYQELERRIGALLVEARDWFSTYQFSGSNDATPPRASAPAASPAPPRPAKARPEPAARREPADGPGRGGLYRMLVVLAQHQPEGCNRAQLALLADLSARGGGFGNYLSKARTSEWIEEQGQQCRITRMGLDALGDYPPLPVGRALLDHWLDWCGGEKSGKRRVLQVLLDAGAAGLDKAELAASAGMEPKGGGFGNYLSELRTAGLIERDGKVSIRAAAVLLEARRRG
jgi:hypothetical protein